MTVETPFAFGISLPDSRRASREKIGFLPQREVRIVFLGLEFVLGLVG
jgi:hypothetical protein